MVILLWTTNNIEWRLSSFSTNHWVYNRVAFHFFQQTIGFTLEWRSFIQQTIGFTLDRRFSSTSIKPLGLHLSTRSTTCCIGCARTAATHRPLNNNNANNNFNSNPRVNHGLIRVDHNHFESTTTASSRKDQLLGPKTWPASSGCRGRNQPSCLRLLGVKGCLVQAPTSAESGEPDREC